MMERAGLYLDYEVAPDGTLRGPERVHGDPGLIGCGRVSGTAFSVSVCIRPDNHEGECRGYVLDVGGPDPEPKP